MQWTDEKIAALAPNDSTERRGRMLANSSKWNLLATNYEAIWGECKGSGSQPYTVQINLLSSKFKCSCPVRKSPCKHILGLFFLYAKSSAVFKYQMPPANMQNWLETHTAVPSNTTSSGTTTIKSDEALEKARIAKEKRWQKRVELMASGMDELELWLTDVVRQGLANTDAQKAGFWNQVAAKMMDAKLPRISNYLKETHQLILKESDWTELAVARLGELYFWVESFKKRAALTAELQEELFQMLGKTVKKADVITQDHSTNDTWTILGKKEGVDIEGRNYRRVWLQGQTSQVMTLFLDYSFGNMGYEQQYTVGDVLKGKVAYYSPISPQRAVPVDLQTAALNTTLTTHRQADMIAFLEQYSQTIAKNPWTSLTPMSIANIKVTINDEQELQLQDANNHIIPILPVSEKTRWKIVALSGGHPIHLFGEWDGLHFEPLSVLDVNKIICLHN